MNYLVFKKTGSNFDDIEFAGVVRGLQKDEGERAIEQFAADPGKYIAISFKEDDVVKVKAESAVVLAEDTGEDEDEEQSPEPEPESPTE